MELSILQVTNNFDRAVHICVVQCSANVADPSTGFPPELDSTSPEYASACGSAGLILEPGQRSYLFSPVAATVVGSGSSRCYDENGVWSALPVGARYGGKLYISYSYEGETSGASRLQVGSIVTAIQIGYS